MPIINDREFSCDWCGEVFDFVSDETWNEEKANKEYEEVFIDSSMSSRDIVCNDCWKIVRPRDAKSS